MPMTIHDLGLIADKRYAEVDHSTPVIAQSSASGMCWNLSSLREAKVTEEMVIMGCDLPVGTDIVLLTLD